MNADNYLGTWTLIPELCIYEQGTPPKEGVYTISALDGVISISIAWTDSVGDAHTLTFGGNPDGRKQATETPGLTHMSLTRIDSNTLDSAAYNDKEQIMYARRVAHNDLLTTLQRIKTGDSDMVIVQVYRRAASKEQIAR